MHGPVSVDEFLMSVRVLGNGTGVKHIRANASSETATLIPRLCGSGGEAIALEHAATPCTAAGVMAPHNGLLTLDVKLHHLPPGFFASLPSSLETLHVWLPTPQGPDELAAAALEFPRMHNLRDVALTHDASSALLLQQALPPGCLLSNPTE